MFKKIFFLNIIFIPSCCHIYKPFLAHTQESHCTPIQSPGEWLPGARSAGGAAWGIDPRAEGAARSRLPGPTSGRGQRDRPGPAGAGGNAPSFPFPPLPFGAAGPPAGSGCRGAAITEPALHNPLPARHGPARRRRGAERRRPLPASLARLLGCARSAAPRCSRHGRLQQVPDRPALRHRRGRRRLRAALPAQQAAGGRAARVSAGPGRAAGREGPGEPRGRSREAGAAGAVLALTARGPAEGQPRLLCRTQRAATAALCPGRGSWALGSGCCPHAFLGVRSVPLLRASNHRRLVTQIRLAFSNFQTESKY